MKEKCGVRKFFFERLRENTSLYKFAFEAFRGEVSRREEYGFLVLPEGLSEYNSLLSKSVRQNIRTAFNRQRRDEKELYYSVTTDITTELSEKMLSIREQRLKKKQKDALKTVKARIYNKVRNIIVKWFSAKQDVFSNLNKQWCFEVRDKKNNNKLVSFFYGVYDEVHDTHYVILAGVDEEYTWYSPSISLLYKFIQDQYEKDESMIRCFDFTRGNERYKSDLGCKIEYICKGKIQL